VDLHPIRAKMADTPETSDYTSVAERIAELREESDNADTSPEDRTPLMPFDATGRMATAIPFAFDDYLELVDAHANQHHRSMRGRYVICGAWGLPVHYSRGPRPEIPATIE
jgi:hypothetical protein